ncbi:MAG TPA: hypothetical protein VGL08_21590 [Paraburkholderia sp.]|jgi:hypothetical protein
MTRKKHQLSADSIVVNGDFSDEANGWTMNAYGSTAQIIDGAAQLTNGGSASQSVAIATGTPSCQFSYAYQLQYTGASAHVVVQAGSGTLYEKDLTDVASWRTVTETLSPASTDGQLTLTFQGNGGQCDFDNVKLTGKKPAGPVPRHARH